jgi:hypothetical protein
VPEEKLEEVQRRQIMTIADGILIAGFCAVLLLLYNISAYLGDIAKQLDQLHEINSNLGRIESNSSNRL